jgi:hypothetical protein
VPLAVLAVLVFGGLLVGAYMIGSSSDDDANGGNITSALAEQAAKNERATAVEVARTRRELRKRFDARLAAATAKAREDGFAAGKAEASAAPIEDGDAGPGNSSDPCAGTYDPEGIC